MLDEEIGADGKRAHRAEADRGDDEPVAREKALGDRHHRAGEAEPEHREADDERTEMRPVADGEDAHDVDLQRDHGSCAEADREIERQAPARIEFHVAGIDVVEQRGGVEAFVHKGGS